MQVPPEAGGHKLTDMRRDGQTRDVVVVDVRQVCKQSAVSLGPQADRGIVGG